MVSSSFYNASTDLLSLKWYLFPCLLVVCADEDCIGAYAVHLVELGIGCLNTEGPAEAPYQP